MGQEYYLGLDLGTASTGWAITDPEYHVLRKHGKALWGVRLFESASTAEERRMFRTGRRRLDRRNWRIQILQEIFAEEICKIDPGFFLRMKESKYYPEDKRDINENCPELPYALFVDNDFTDKDYHKKFPTIYHLRKMLMNTEDTLDIRLVYLAIHHMLKHRGHFLLSGDISEIKEFGTTFSKLLENIKNEELNWNLELRAEEYAIVESILKDNMLNRSTKKTRLIKALKAKSTCEKAVLNLLAGGTVKLSDIFGLEELNETERPKISFADNGYDDYIGEVENELGEQFYIIETAKAVYDWAVLVEILGEHTSISEAKVATYEKHKSDLRFLKKIVRKYLTKEEYKDIFVSTSDKLKNYSAYIGMTKINGKKVDLQSKRCNKEEFYDFIKKGVLKKIEGQPEYEYLKEEIERETFLPKQVNKDNGVIPYQIHLYELKKILGNLQDKIDFIKENEDKLVQLFEFRIPYYVGPLNKIDDGKEEKFTWAVRKCNEKIYPWNFDDVIDIEASAEKFIRRMTNKCTYLIGEDVLPKDSLLYSKYMVLNELNNLKLDGEKLSVELKQQLYIDVFCKYRKVTVKKVKNYLKCEGIISGNVEITGIDGDFKASLTAYHDFKEILTGTELAKKDKENIIMNIVLFGDDKKLLKKRMNRLYPQITPNQLKKICALSYKGWGRFSKKFLEEIVVPAPETGEAWNIITALWESKNNLMQLLSNEFQFMEEVETYNMGKQAKTLSYETVENMYVSPSVKRQIWQTLKIVKELEKVMKESPKRIFIEMAREKQESKRAESRKKQLMDLYKACKNEEKDWVKELGEQEEQKLRSDKLYLYYTQKGRCMYSGEVIELEDLWDNTKYDIDHIYPQSKTMDDSLKNRVLVKKEYNAAKLDIYPLSKMNENIQPKMQGFWKSLLDGGFISKEKYERLVRNTELSPEELAGFIERQIVETRQSTKAVAEILKQVFPESEIVYVKAGTVSRFRKDFELLKVREVNDLHHAKDAYLNIVVGNSYYVKFTKNATLYVKENPGRTFNLKKMFISKWDIERNGEVAWKAGGKGTIVTVKQTMNKNNILVTRQVHEAKGGLFDQQIMKKGKGQIAIKESDERLASIEKYGGYNKAAGAYFMLVESKDKKDKTIRTMEFIPLYLKNKIESDESIALNYLEKDRGLKEPNILVKKIKIDTLFDVDGFKMWLSGRTGDQLLFKGANQLLLSNEHATIMKKILKFVNRQKENKKLLLVDNDEITEEMLIQIYDMFYEKIKNTVYNVRLSAQEKTLSDKKKNFLNLKKEEKCVVLSEILHLFQCQSTSANLKMIGGPGKAGILVMNNNISKCNKISIINQSPTGVFENEIDLLKI